MDILDGISISIIRSKLAKSALLGEECYVMHEDVSEEAFAHFYEIGYDFKDHVSPTRGPMYKLVINHSRIWANEHLQGIDISRQNK